MIDKIILRLKLLVAYFRCKSTPLKQRTGKRIFVFLGADYGNLGDVAITYAQVHFLQEHYPDYQVVEIPIGKTFEGIKSVRRNIDKDDIITLIGGGNTSDLYDDIEFLRQLVIWKFREYTIIGFPQTTDFSCNNAGRFTKMSIKFVYSFAKHLFFMAREENTFNEIKRLLPNLEVEMMPDIVMLLDERQDYKRDGLLVCLRSDKEKTKDDRLRDEVLRELSSHYVSVTYRDTQVEAVNVENRYSMMRDIWSCFSHHEAILTDRLHGMIFAFITGTPAYVLDNSNHKIRACYKWIKDCGYIKLVNSIDDLAIIDFTYNFQYVHSSIARKFNTLPCLKFH